MIINQNTTLQDFIFQTDIFKIPENEIKNLFEKIEKLPIPEYISKIKVPESLDNLTFAELIELQELKTFEKMLFGAPEIIMHLKKEKLLKAKAFDVIRFFFFIKSEIERIAKLFEQIRYKPSEMEASAGINQIDNGIFGIIDWYARRMGIIDHDFAAKATQWTVVYACMKIDNTNAMFERKLRDSITKKSRKK